MADDAELAMPADERIQGSICPWCSAVLPTPDAAVCPSCDARLLEAADVEIPGLTAVDPALLAAAAAPRKIKRSIGSLLVGNDEEIPPPSEAEMPALARPAADVRREILRLEMDARLASLTAEVASRNAEGVARLASGAPLATGPEEPGTGEPLATGPTEPPAMEPGEPPARD